MNYVKYENTTYGLGWEGSPVFLFSSNGSPMQVVPVPQESSDIQETLQHYKLSLPIHREGIVRRMKQWLHDSLEILQQRL